jgi:hypothetical protein
VEPEQLPPSAIAHLGGVFGRAGDVGRQDRGQDPIRHRWGPGTGEELLDLGGNRLSVPDERQVVAVRELDEPGPGDAHARRCP